MQEEKHQLTQALNRAHRELQTDRDELMQQRTAYAALQDELQQAQHFHNEVQRDLRCSKKHAASEIQRLEQVAQEHYSRANRLAETLQTARNDYLELRKQVRTLCLMSVSNSM